MANREYRVVYAKTVPGLAVAATGAYTILLTTVREFQRLDSRSDNSFAPEKTGKLQVKTNGYVALAYKDV